MIHSRSQGFVILYTKEQQDRINNNCCPMCGCSKDEWKKGRQRQWRCCSVKCSIEHDNVATHYWPRTREQIIDRDGKKCVKCGKTNCSFVVDHITPIAVGGSEWDKNNMQTLCLTCNKQKTAKDMKIIAIERKISLSQVRE
jgi:5-methylcytosine-specific restriction endonuclease McrA